MKTFKRVMIVSLILSLPIVAATSYFFLKDENPPSTALMTSLNDPSREISSINEYDAKNACEKQEILWRQILSTRYKELPPYEEMNIVDVVALGFQALNNKGYLESDIAPKGWKKHLHRRGSIAKVKFVSHSNRYSGVFKGAECGLLRLSLTYSPSGKSPVAPGLALKLFRDSHSSANISALVSIEGQAKNFNFFKHPLSNIVPLGKDRGHKLVHNIFSKVSDRPEELLTHNMAQVDAQGHIAGVQQAPRQLFFVPAMPSEFSSRDHDVRDDFAKIPSGTLLYQVKALPIRPQPFEYLNYTADDGKQFLTESEHIGDLVTTSPFIASQFGDDGIFFKHQWRSKKK